MNDLSFTLDPGPHDRINAPVEIPAPDESHGDTFIALPGNLPVQRVGNTLCLIVDKLEAGKPATFTLSRGNPSRANMTIVEARDALEFREGDNLVTQYNYGEEAPYPLPSKPYFYPVNLNGLCLTRAVAPRGAPEPKIDHPHHRSLWVAFGDVAGNDVWCDEEGHGFQRHQAFGRMVSGPVLARFEEDLIWESGSGQPLLKERRVFKAWRGIDGGRMLDLQVALTAFPKSLTLGDTKEGGICSIRVQEPLQGDQTGMLTNAFGGRTEKECWGYRSPWIDYSGTLEGRKVGIAIMDHPKSFRHPTHWHARDYGLCTANPFAWHDYKSGWSLDGSHFLAEGATIGFSYRVFLHEGDGAAAGVAGHWLNFAFPPSLKK